MASQQMQVLDVHAPNHNAAPYLNKVLKLTKCTLYLLDRRYEIKSPFSAALFLTNVSANHPLICSSKSILDIEYKTQHILGTWVTMEWDCHLSSSPGLVVSFMMSFAILIKKFFKRNYYTTKISVASIYLQ